MITTMLILKATLFLSFLQILSEYWMLKVSRDFWQDMWFQTHNTFPIAFPHVAVWLACKQCILFKFTNCSHHLEWIEWNLHKDIQERKAFLPGRVTRRQKCITTTKTNISTMKMGEDASLGIRMTSEICIGPKTKPRCFFSTWWQKYSISSRFVLIIAV